MMVQRRNQQYEFCDPGDRHCEPIPEQDQNIFDRDGGSSGSSNSSDSGATGENGWGNSSSSSGSDNVGSCVSDATGSYNSVDTTEWSSGSSAASQEADLVVEFQYQVQTSLSLTSTKLQSNSSALLAIEKAVSDILVASLFEDCQTTTVANNVSESNDNSTVATLEPANEWGWDRRRRRQKLRKLSRRPVRRDQVDSGNSDNENVLTGISAAPSDRLLPGRAAVLCRTDLVPQADRCFIVGGAYSLRGIIGDIAWVQSLSTIVIREAMERGQLNAIHPDILDVHFVFDKAFNPDSDSSSNSSSIPPISSDNGARNGASLENGDGSVQALPWIFLSLGALAVCGLLIGLACLVRRGGGGRRRRKALLDDNERLRQEQLKEQDRVLQNRTVTFETEVPSTLAPSFSSTTAGGAATTAMARTPPTGGSVGRPYTMDPVASREIVNALDPYLSGTGKSDEAPFYVSPLQEDEEVYNAFDRLLEAVALEDSASSSDGEDDSSGVLTGHGSFPLHDVEEESQ